MVTDEIFQGGSYFGFVVHRIHHSFGAVLANIELSHGTAAMTEDAIVVSRSIAEEGIGTSNAFIPMMNICNASCWCNADACQMRARPPSRDAVTVSARYKDTGVSGALAVLTANSVLTRIRSVSRSQPSVSRS
jgi:hypothetical protein